MARRRKPCEFCSGDYEGEMKDHRNRLTMWVEVYPFNQVLTVLAQATVGEEGEFIEDYIDVQMNYCPVCGRKLTDD